MTDTLDCNIVVSKFKLQSHYYIHFCTYNLCKDMKVSLLFIYKDDFGIK